MQLSMFLSVAKQRRCLINSLLIIPQPTNSVNCFNLTFSRILRFFQRANFLFVSRLQLFAFEANRVCTPRKSVAVKGNCNKKRSIERSVLILYYGTPENVKQIAVVTERYFYFAHARRPIGTVQNNKIALFRFGSSTPCGTRLDGGSDGRRTARCAAQRPDRNSREGLQAVPAQRIGKTNRRREKRRSLTKR